MDTDGEVYPMPLFVKLVVSDVATSVEWYEALGFAVVYAMPVMAHVRYRRYADVMLVDDRARAESVESDTQRGQGVAIYLTLEDEPVDEVATRAHDAGAEVLAEPHETGWNTHELGLADPDGYELIFSEVVDAERSFESVTGADA